MPFVNRTADFRELLKSRHDAPEPKRRKLTRENTKEDPLGKQYVAEAYIILGHITSLNRMLSSLKKPYLNFDARSTPFSRQTTRNFDFSGIDSSFGSIKYLTNEERDQIDLQARVVLTRCSDRIKEMEALEKRRAKIVESNANPLSRFLPSRLRQDDFTASSKAVAAHHASITWYLNRRLTEVSQAQKEMQEERVKRQLERTRTLGSGAGIEAARMGIREPPITTIDEAQKTSWLGDASSNFIAATIGAPSPVMERQSSSSSSYVDVSLSADEDDDDDDDELELSESQIQQFETENANILRDVQDRLESVQQAEANLMDISALQMELIQHLTQQTEMTEQLYEDAIATTSMVEKGNEQLREARRRAKDSRLFILVFLIGASFSLLFLHYY